MVLESVTPDQVFTGTVVIIGAITWTAKKFKFVSFGRTKKIEEDGCPDAACHNKVVMTSKNVEEIKADFHDFKRDIYPKINKTSTDVAKIKGLVEGWIEGQRN